MQKKHSKNIFLVILLITSLMSLFFVPWPVLIASLTPLPNSIQEQLDDTIEQGFNGAIVYIDKTGNAPEYYAAGWHDKYLQIPAVPDALFKIASIGKLYDAAILTKLVSQQQLSLDATLAEYFPNLVGRIANVESITVRMLVQHRSGIANITDTKDFWTNPPDTDQEALQRILDLPAKFLPDQDYHYSNSNYLLISMLIEQVTSQHKFQVIKEEILTPLGLINTYGGIEQVDIDRLMSGYYVGVAEDIKSVDYGSMVATARDVAIFVRALNDGSLFTEDEQQLYSSLYVYDHTGLIPGYQSIARYHKDIDAVVIQFTNTTDFEGYQWSLSEISYQRIIQILNQ